MPAEMINKPDLIAALQVLKAQKMFAQPAFVDEEPTCADLSRCQLHSIPVNRCSVCWRLYLRDRLSVIVAQYHLAHA